MISVEIESLPSAPSTLTPEKTRELMSKIIDAAPLHELNTKYNSTEVREYLKGIYGLKCAYCESEPIGSSAFRVDHYRPKKHVAELAKSEHYGYYWLALEPTNLIQSCEACNRVKLNHFPLESENERVNALQKQPEVVGEEFRDFQSALLKAEKRLLLHPLYDKVEEHLVFLPNGEVQAKNKSAHGEKSIRHYDLNRKGLIWQRKRLIDTFFFRLVAVLNAYEDYGASTFALRVLEHELETLVVDLLLAQASDKAYSRLGFYMLFRFEEFFVERLPDELEEHKRLVLGVLRDKMRIIV